jgi:DNA polymerase III delta subunit
MSPESLRPVYLLTGSDRPKRSVALRRLRDRFGPDSVEHLSAHSSSGADTVASANALGLFGESGGGRAVVVESVENWRKADVDALQAYLEDPTPDTVLVLVADDPKKDSPLEKLAAAKGEVLRYDIPKGAKLVTWTTAQFKEAGVSADTDAARALVEEGLAIRDIASRLRMKEFPARKALQQAERYSRAELDAALVRLAELDAAIKGASRLSAELELLLAMVDVTREAQPVAAG